MVIIEAVRIREHSYSTGLKYGLAVPHGSVDCVQDIVAALGTSARKGSRSNPRTASRRGW